MTSATTPPSPDGYDPFVRAMMRVSERAKQAERRLTQPADIAWPVREASKDEREPPIISRLYAEPIAPLRDRDEVALQDIFTTTQLEDAITDIQDRLSHLYPEPCWEDDPYDFLHGYV